MWQMIEAYPPIPQKSVIMSFITRYYNRRGKCFTTTRRLNGGQGREDVVTLFKAERVFTVG